jgi:hypothetical protein
MFYKKVSWKPKNIKVKLNGELKRDSSLFLGLIDYKGLGKKGIISYKGRSEEIVLSRLNNRYKLYIEMLKTQDNLNNVGINLFNENKEHFSKNNYLSIIKDKNKIINLFNEKLNIENPYYLGRKYIGKNILEENYNNLETRKMSSKLLLPHYFFTGRFNEKSMPSQIRSWTNSVYNFLKKDQSSIKYIDDYTSKLIKLFFSIKYIKTRKIWNTTLFNVYKIIPHVLIIKYINRMVRYTSPRSTWSLSKINNYPSVILTITWLQNQIKYASILNKYIRNRKNTLFGLYKPKLQIYYRKKRRGWLSKPLFKHTSHNLIIDLFIFNNKKNNIRKFSNIISRRALYKYMYSMYINCMNKVKETINRPRFFYINLIEPKTYNYYSNIVKTYEELLVRDNKANIFYICLLILNWNQSRKNYIHYIKNEILKKLYFLYNDKGVSNINNYFNFSSKNINKENNSIEFDNKNKVIFKRSLYYKCKNEEEKEKEFFFLNNNKGIKVKNKIGIQMFDLHKKLFLQKKHSSDQIKKKKNIIRKKPKYLKLRKYLLSLEKKSNVPLDLNKLTLWSKKGLGKDVFIKKNKKIPKIYKYNKYSLEEFKKKIYYAKGKTKRKIAPSIWKTKLMNFYLLSKKQKKNINSNRNYINYKENEFYRFIPNMPKIRQRHVIKKSIDLNLKKEKNREISSLYYNNINLLDTKINNVDINNNKSECNLFNDKLFDKKEYLKNIINMNKNEINILNSLFKRFYIIEPEKKAYFRRISDKKNIFLDLYTNSLSNLNSDNISHLNSNREYNRYFNNKKKRKYYSIYNYYFHYFNYNSSNKKVINSKYLWDNLDYSLINVLSNVFLNYKKVNNQFKLSSYNNLFNKINNIVINNDMLYLDIVKKEFYNVNRDIILFKIDKINLMNIYTDINTYMYTDNNIFNNIRLNNSINNKDNNLNKSKNNLSINIWSFYANNKGKSEHLKYKMEYSENIFKPYYRYIIPLFIFESYKSFISYINYNNLIYSKKISFFSNINWIKSNNLIIFNFIIVRTLLDLIQYNYRSLIRVKPKYYYLNTMRYYGSKIRRLHFNTWITSVKYIKRLRKTPRYFWKRYNRLASLYFGRVIQSAELNTKRKILLPFVIYFEDLLYVIYGKWSIIRLWPIKRYYLNSYILTERIMTMLTIRRDKWNAVKEYRKSARKLISIFRWFQIKKAYDYINEYNTRWPDSLVNIMKDSKSRSYLGYNKLEFFNEKLEKQQMLSTYPIEKNSLKSYLSIVNNQYIQTMYNYVEKLNKSIYVKRVFLKNEGKIKSQIYVRYWLKPLNTYIFTMKQGIDITGIKFRLGGRTGVSASNARRFKKFYFFGNLIGPRHFNKRTRKITNLTNPILRNTVRSNIDYAYNVGINKNGCITLKVWLSSLFSSDLHELLLFLVRIKYLYDQLINRYYLAHSKFIKFDNNWLLQQNNDFQIYFKEYKVEDKKMERLKLKRIRYKLNKRFIIERERRKTKKNKNKIN